MPYIDVPDVGEAARAFARHTAHSSRALTRTTRLITQIPATATGSLADAVAVRTLPPTGVLLSVAVGADGSAFDGTGASARFV